MHEDNAKEAVILVASSACIECTDKCIHGGLQLAES